jgi:hypothetical protein
MCLQRETCLQNRVDPFGAIHANPARGLFMGNRGGKIHDPASKTLLKRRFASRQWITCVIEFRGRYRQVMGNSYTELFFLDEVTAFAAGHRPCAECRRAEFKRYCADVSPEVDDLPKADAIDRKLHGERMGEKTVLASETCGQLPDGTMVAVGHQAFARRGAMALPWSFTGYGAALAWEIIAQQNPVLLTPPTNIAALQNGYLPVWHPSAGA